MNELIKLTDNDVGGEQIRTVNARDLHDFLGVKSKYQDWFKNRVKDFGFVENQDFITVSKNLESGGRTIEHHVSLSMAKELSMVERNEKGKEARQYFIQCEKIAKEKTAAALLPDFTNPAIAARAWAEQYEHRLAAEKECSQLILTVEEQKPKVEYADAIIAAKDHYPMREAAKIIGYKPSLMKDYLRRAGWLYATKDVPMQSHIVNGDMVLRTAHFTRTDGTPETKAYPHLTNKGIFSLYRKMLKEGEIERSESLELQLKD